jgi:polar amino acid transport system substrate-binding protein
MTYVVTYLCILLGVLGSLHPVHADDITFGTHFIKPFTWEEDGELKGFAVDVVKAMMNIMDIPEQFTMLPFARGLKDVQTQPNRAFFIVPRRPEREDTVKWVGPLVTNGVYFYKKKGSSVHIESLEDLRSLKRIGVGRGNADETFLQSKGFTNLYSTTNQKQSLQMLVRGRIDVTPMGELVMPEMAKDAGIDMNEIERTDLKLYDSVVYLVFSKNVSDDIVSQWQQALDTLKDSGVYQEMYQKYIL